MSQPRTPVFAANWKMCHGPDETGAFVERFAASYRPRSDATVVVFPPAISLAAFAAAVSGRPDLEFGVQDVHTEVEGAHTSAISAAMVPATGATWALAGHSERRREFGDTDPEVGRKLVRILEAGLRSVLCVGETLEERESGRLAAVLETQIREALHPLDREGRTRLVYAYEPVWAIGTGLTASPADAAEAHAIVRERLAQTEGCDAERAVILYGGSVKPANIDALLAAPGVDGVLVGGASLDPDSWAAICAAGR
ncbi:triose-phosphate isomerase [Candidatus Palauibacter soopunensis]|uniref:triose-phosphate isomerase n=1 Tax=Candidatus Palauibacter soopunensis TaxID=3056739 RepID=UPI00239C2837|nr:triose-phosphate isomerase [Candidatus Palauibacter soopunensis]MDE2880076.1 triose-phosphate isomerase [Candidatus Palauibacter soopunensis]